MVEVVVLGLEPSSSQMWGKDSTTEVCFQSLQKGFEDLYMIDNLKQWWLWILVLNWLHSPSDRQVCSIGRTVHPKLTWERGHDHNQEQN